MSRQKISVDELKPMTGTVTEGELGDLLDMFDVKAPEEIEFPFCAKLTKRHALHIERRSSQRLGKTGLESLFNWRVSENMVEQLARV